MLGKRNKGTFLKLVAFILLTSRQAFARSYDEYEDEHPELRRRRLQLQAEADQLQSKRRAGMESGHCKLDITVGERSVNIKVQGEGSVEIRVKQDTPVPPPPYIP